MIADANAESVRASLQAAKVNGRVIRIAAPQFIILDGKRLYVSRKRVKQFPEPVGCDRLHVRGGHSR